MTNPFDDPLLLVNQPATNPFEQAVPNVHQASINHPPINIPPPHIPVHLWLILLMFLPPIVNPFVNDPFPIVIRLWLVLILILSHQQPK